MACLRKILIFYFRVKKSRKKRTLQFTEYTFLCDIGYGVGNKLLEITINYSLRRLGVR